MPVESHPPFHPALAALARDSRLHAILAVVLVLYKSPTLLQIGHVLDIPWSEVRDHLLLISHLLESSSQLELYYSNIHLSSDLRNFLVDSSHSETFVDIPKWHGFVAGWCLNRSRLNNDAGDVLYAAKYWAHHVCSSRPSEDIWDALRCSPLPCRLTSQPVLPYVIAWLKKVDVDDTRELVAKFHHRLARHYEQTARRPVPGSYGYRT
ncbi:hypothetical protein C8J57DRAFT_1378204 [Mycena rebaudengoi]|nr:hypothetical protein C8J57DRAFT_1378204 [Mycena rebaudengoi]